jgi:putative transposase
MSKTYTRTEYHLVFSTAHRNPWLTKEVRSELYRIIGYTVRARGGFVHTIGGIEDHAHLDLEIPVSQRACDMVASIKGNSARWLKERWPHLKDFRWQKGYYLFSVSCRNADALRRYIDTQPSHHQRFGLVQEMEALLRLNHVELPEDLFRKEDAFS